MEKITFDLTGVPHTLLFPLLGRVLVSREKDSPLQDKRAIQVLESLNYDFAELEERFNKVSSSTSWAADRAIYFDNEVKRFLKDHPRGTVVNMGAGLETAFYRVDNGLLNWVDLDLPQVMSIREKLLPPPARVHYLAKSVLDFSWMAEVKRFGNEVFFFAGGLLMYLKQAEVKSLFVEMAQQFNNAELVFDCIAQADLLSANEMFKNFKVPNVSFQWGFEQADVAAWTPKLKVLSHTEQNFMHTTMSEDEKDQQTFKGYMTKVGFLA